MKRFVFLFLIPFIFIGCGGGGSSSDSGSTIYTDNSSEENTPSQNISSNSFDTWEYIVPNNSLSSKAISSKSIDGTSYQATYRSIEPNTIVEEIPQNTTDERVLYEKRDKDIEIKFIKNDIKTYSYAIKRYVSLGEQTIDNSSCMLVNHFNSKNINGTDYSDVIEIDCGKHKGFYAKGIGEIYQE